MAVVAFVSHGKLHIAREGAPPRAYESAYGESVRERARQMRRKDAWKTEGAGARFMSGGLLWSRSDADPDTVSIQLTSLARGFSPDELLYTLAADGLVGVFAFRTSDGSERRLTHGNEGLPGDLCASTELGLLACSLPRSDGTSAIAVMNEQAGNLREVTEGDSRDLAPSWVPGPRRRLVYQSAGIGRDRNGAPIGLAPFSLHELDLERGEVGPLLELPGRDLLGPRLTEDGTLYFIERPHKSPGRSPLRAVLDVVMIPPRLLWALFQYLNFFSARYTGKPLTTAGGPRREGADLRRMMVWGNLIDAEAEARRNARGGDEPPAIVPRTWRLMRRRSGAAPEPLAESVLAYDIAADGTLLYSTGSAIYRLSGDGRNERVLSAAGIERIVSLG